MTKPWQIFLTCTVAISALVAVLWSTNPSPADEAAERTKQHERDQAAQARWAEYRSDCVAVGGVPERGFGYNCAFPPPPCACLSAER